MNLIINGKTENFDQLTLRLEELLQLHSLVPEAVAVEVNARVLPRAEIRQALLNDGDRVEIVRFVGGGSQ
ncbi:MAG: sulfur carrier protein ThiS [Candidatus Omnitrophica bacterium]|nr:sulfur carrier protein ThiS [Candidatus Omnitrophota bacterium]